MDNYKILYGFRILKSTIELFVNSFFVMYFLNISNNNVLKLGLYYIVVYTTLFVIVFLCRDVCKSKKRINLLRIGIVLNFIYFLLIFLLKQKLVDYMYLMGFIYGLEEGFYYSIYNNFESNGISNQERAKFTGTYTCIKSIISIIVPLIFGTVITDIGFGKCTIVVLFLVIVQIILSILFKDINLIDNKKTDLKLYKRVISKNEMIKNMYRVNLLNGFIFTGAFSSVVVIYIINAVNTNFNLGVFTSVFALVSSGIGYLFAKVIPMNKYSIILKYTTLLTVLGLLMVMIKTNFVTIVLFNLFQTISSTLFSLIISNCSINMANNPEIKDKYKVEYFIGIEKNIFIGRFISYIMYIIIGLSNSILLTNFILVVFIVLFTLLSYKINESYFCG